MRVHGVTCGAWGGEGKIERGEKSDNVSRGVLRNV